MVKWAGVCVGIHIDMRVFTGTYVCARVCVCVCVYPGIYVRVCVGTAPGSFREGGGAPW